MAEQMTLAQAVGLARSAGGNAQAAAEAVFAHRRTLAAGLLQLGADDASLSGRLAEMTPLTQQQLPWDPAPEDVQIFEAIAAAWTAPAPAANVIMAAMALAPAHHFPVLSSLALVPAWLRGAYARYLVAMPALFVGEGEAERFGGHALEAMSRLHDAIFVERLPDARDLATAVFNATCEMIYFNGLLLRPYFRKRARIVEWYLLQTGLRLNWSFPALTAAPAKVGIVCRSLKPGTESYYLLAHFEGSAFAKSGITLYLTDPIETPLSPIVRAATRDVVALPADLSQAVDRIRADELDLVVIANNVTYGPSREAALAAHRLARLQVMGAASPVTTGWSNADLFLSGQANDPFPDAPDDFEERLVRLPGTAAYFAFSYDTDPQTVTFTREQLGLGPNEVAFFSAANFYKLVPEVIGTWVEILTRSPNARLMVMPFNPNWGDSYAAGLFLRRLHALCDAAGVDRARIRLIGRVPTRADLLGVMALADIYLDSFPFPGSCSLIDPLLVGLPVVARSGERLRTAIAASMLPLEGVGESVCATREAYVERAVRLAADASFRAAETEHLRAATADGLVCLKANVFGGKFADFCTGAIARHRQSAAALEAMPLDALRARAAAAAARAMADAPPSLLLMTDAALAEQLIAPYLRRADGERRLVELGARSGVISALRAAGAQVAVVEADAGAVDVLRLGAGFSVDLPRAIALRPRVVFATAPAAVRKGLAARLKAAGYDGLALGYREGDPAARAEVAWLSFDDDPPDAAWSTSLWWAAEDRAFVAELVRFLEADLRAAERPALIDVWPDPPPGALR